MTNKEIGEHVAAFMAERGWDDKQMAKYCEVFPYHVRNAIKADCRSTQALAQIARKVGLEVPGLTSEGKRRRPTRKTEPNPLRDMVVANGHTWTELAIELGFNSSGPICGAGVLSPIQPRMFKAFEKFTGLTHEELLKLSLRLCKSPQQKRMFASRYEAIYGHLPVELPAGTERRVRVAGKQRIRIPATIVGIEQEMDRLREEAPADETPEQRTKRIEHLDVLWRARRDLRAKIMEDAV